MEKSRNAASISTQRRLSGMIRRAPQRVTGRRYQGLLFEAIATKLSDGREFWCINCANQMKVVFPRSMPIRKLPRNVRIADNPPTTCVEAVQSRLSKDVPEIMNVVLPPQLPLGDTMSNARPCRPAAISLHSKQKEQKVLGFQLGRLGIGRPGRFNSFGERILREMTS